MAITQLRAFGALTGRRYGSFAGKAATRHVGVLTQLRAFGAFTGRRYGSFADRAETIVIPPDTQIPVSPAGRPRFAVKRPRNEDEELFLIITAALHVLDS